MPYSTVVIYNKMHYVEIYWSSHSYITDLVVNWLSEEIAFACNDFP
jgi:hypothetical protein